MPSDYGTRHRRPTDPAIRVFEITPDDGTDLPEITAAINVATPGVVRVTTEDGSTSDVMVHPGAAFPTRAHGKAGSRRCWNRTSQISRIGMRGR